MRHLLLVLLQHPTVPLGGERIMTGKRGTEVEQKQRAEGWFDGGCVQGTNARYRRMPASFLPSSDFHFIQICQWADSYTPLLSHPEKGRRNSWQDLYCSTFCGLQCRQIIPFKHEYFMKFFPPSFLFDTHFWSSCFSLSGIDWAKWVCCRSRTPFVGQAGGSRISFLITTCEFCPCLPSTHQLWVPKKVQGHHPNDLKSCDLFIPHTIQVTNVVQYN